MSYFDSIKMFANRTMSVVCPKCSYASEQQCSKLRKNIMLICPNCGTLFLPTQK